jgi:hypothetical protein
MNKRYANNKLTIHFQYISNTLNDYINKLAVYN